MGSEYQNLDSVSWCPYYHRIFRTGSVTPDEHDSMAGRKVAQCGAFYGDCRVPAGTA